VTLELIAAGVFAILAAIAAAFRIGRKSAATKAEAAASKAYIDTRKRMDEATVDHGVDAARGWLRERGKRDL
jgi:hypothetical protein